MSLPVIIRPEAEQDLLVTRDWYDRHQERLGDKFADQASSLFEQISTNPRLFGVIWKDVRACRLRRFPYLVHYRVLEDRVEVLAVLHASRDASTWQSRT